MYGGSVSESWRAINWDGNVKTEYMGTAVAANTGVTSVGNVDRNAAAIGFVNGGFIAAGGAKTATIQSNPNGFAKANATGSYNGSGPLGQSFNGSANGYTQTSSTTQSGYNGSIMNSQAGMSVVIGDNPN